MTKTSTEPVNRTSGAHRTVISVIGTLLGLASMFVVIGLLAYWSRPAGTVQVDAAARQAKLAELQAADQKTLTTYGWVNKSRGVVRIPIEVAMEKVLAEGLPPTTVPAK